MQKATLAIEVGALAVLTAGGITPLLEGGAGVLETGAAGGLASRAPDLDDAPKVPDILARVIAGDLSVPTLGRPGADDVSVTAAEDIADMNPAQLAERLTIPQSSTFTIYTFQTPAEGLASLVLRTEPGFVGGGLTARAVPEFVMLNGPIPAGAVRTVVGR